MWGLFIAKTKKCKYCDSAFFYQLYLPLVSCFLSNVPATSLFSFPFYNFESDIPIQIYLFCCFLFLFLFMTLFFNVSLPTEICFFGCFCHFKHFDTVLSMSGFWLLFTFKNLFEYQTTTLFLCGFQINLFFSHKHII